MACKETGKGIGSLAGKTLGSKTAGKTAKRLAGSVLSQVPPKPKKRRRK